MEIKFKVCSKCGEPLAPTSDNFYKDRSKKDGFQSACISCVHSRCAEYYQKNKSEIAEQQAGYYRENKQTIAKRQTEYHQKKRMAQQILQERGKK